MSDSLAVLEPTRALRPMTGTVAPSITTGPATTFSDAATFGQALARSAAPAPRRLASYELGPQIGAGGMGTVFQARHMWLGRQVAIKFISAQLLNNTEAASRFLHECRAIGSLDHPNIVRATDAGQADGVHYLVTEFVQGADLASLVARRGQFSVADACEAARQAALGLAHAHENGLVHRDVKPSNLLVDGQGTVKLLDFGLARMAEGQTTLTMTGQVIGTLDFLAPEQATDARLVNPSCDQYSLGCTLYFLLAGVPPFGGPAYETPASKLKGHLTDRPAPVNELRRRTPLALVACLERMMAKSPADRYETIADAAEALEPFCHEANLAALVGGDPLRNPARRRESNPGLFAGCGDMAERLVAVFGWALRGTFAGQPAAGGGPARKPWISLSGLAMFAFLGFILTHFSCVPLGTDGTPITKFGDGDVEVFEFGFGGPPRAARPAPPRPPRR